MRDVVAGALKAGAKSGQVVVGEDSTRRTIEFFTESGCLTDDSAVVGAGEHDAGRTERHVGGAHESSSEEEVFDVATVEGAVGDLVDALAVPLIAAGFGGMHAVGRVQVERPAAEGDGVVVAALFDHVLLDQHGVAFEAAALAFARDVADPFEGEVGCVGEFPAVFDVVPDAVDDPPEFPLDVFGLRDGVEVAAVFDPPELAGLVIDREIPEARNHFLDVFDRKAWRGVGHRVADVLAHEVDGVAEEIAVFLGGGKSFAEFVAALRSHAERRSGQKPEDSVARGVDKQVGFNGVAGAILAAERLDAANAIGVRGVLSCNEDGGVEQ